MKKISTVGGRIRYELWAMEQSNAREQGQVNMKQITKDLTARYQRDRPELSNSAIEDLVEKAIARGMRRAEPTSMPKPPPFPVRSSVRRRSRRGF